MHIRSSDPDTASLSHGDDVYTPIEGTAAVVFDVPWELGQMLVSFPGWQEAVAEDFGPEHPEITPTAITGPPDPESDPDGEEEEPESDPDEEEPESDPEEAPGAEGSEETPRPRRKRRKPTTQE